MAINANHPFEELNGTRCAVVEKNCSKDRVAFLTYILEGNDFTVITVPSPPPKAAPPKPAPAATDASGSQDLPAPAPSAEESAPAVETFTVGVTDVTFNVTNAIYGRLLRSPDGHVVTMAYWQQKESESRDEIPYYEQNRRAS